MIDRRAFMLAGSAAFFGGCTSILPKDGPDTRPVVLGAETHLASRSYPVFPYTLVDLTPSVIACLRDYGPGSFYATFGMGKGSGVATVLVGVGDAVQVTIFESSAGGLFISADNGARPGNFVTLPPQNVDQNGYISVPYAGGILARGRTVADIQAEIVQKLSSRAIEPQVVVSITSQTSSQATVIGQVGLPTRLSINPAGEKVLDVLSRAAGIRDPGYETFVTLQRRGRKATIYFLNLISHPSENIFVQPGDTLYVYQEKRAFSAFGATGQSGQYYFLQEHLTLSDAVGRAGGLLDNRADPRAVFLYRPEHRERLSRMGVDLAKFPKEAALIPTIYRINLRDPGAIFLAQGFYLQNRDAIYVSNADQIELNKFLAFVTSLTGAAATVTTDIATTKAAGKAIGQ